MKLAIGGLSYGPKIRIDLDRIRLAESLGFEAAATKIQDLYLGGQRNEAIAAVPDELIDAVHLVGSEGKIRDRLQAWKEAGKRRRFGAPASGGRFWPDSQRCAGGCR